MSVGTCSLQRFGRASNFVLLDAASAAGGGAGRPAEKGHLPAAGQATGEYWPRGPHVHYLRCHLALTDVLQRAAVMAFTVAKLYK